MSDLVTFLRARLDVDEHWVQALRTRGEDSLADRMCRQVEAGRAILALHTIKVTKVDVTPFDPHTGERRPNEYEVTCDICGWASDLPGSACETLRILAAVYSTHPDYQPGWKP